MSRLRTDGKQCEQCHKPLRYGSRFCSPTCRGRAGVTGFRKGNRVNVGRPFHQSSRQKLSRANSLPKVSIECIGCPTWFVVYQYQARITSSRPKRFCTRKCAAGYYSGPRHYCWSGGKATLREQIKASLAYRAWRLAVFRRDNFTCVKCNEREEVSGELEADHFPSSFGSILLIFDIKTLQEALQCPRLWDVSNGRTLCRDCHKKTPNYGGKNMAHLRRLKFFMSLSN